MENRVKILLILLVIISIALIIYFMKFNEKSSHIGTLDQLNHKIEEVSNRNLDQKLKNHSPLLEDTRQMRLIAESGMNIPLFDNDGEIHVIPFTDIMGLSEKYAEAALAIASQEIFNLETQLGVDHHQKFASAIKALESYDILKDNPSHKELAEELERHLPATDLSHITGPGPSTLKGQLDAHSALIQKIRGSIFNTSSGAPSRALFFSANDTRYVPRGEPVGIRVGSEPVAGNNLIMKWNWAGGENEEVYNVAGTGGSPDAKTFTLV